MPSAVKLHTASARRIGSTRASAPSSILYMVKASGYTVLFIHEYTELVIMCACMIYYPHNDSAISKTGVGILQAVRCCPIREGFSNFNNRPKTPSYKCEGNLSILSCAISPKVLALLQGLVRSVPEGVGVAGK
jgi:hypothetical protein